MGSVRRERSRSRYSRPFPLAAYPCRFISFPRAVLLSLHLSLHFLLVNWAKLLPYLFGPLSLHLHSARFLYVRSCLTHSACPSLPSPCLTTCSRVSPSYLRPLRFLSHAILIPSLQHPTVRSVPFPFLIHWHALATHR